jgi:uncharacterized paraquat-inducible protein A
MRITKSRVPVPQQHGTLWRCGQCGSLVSIHSVFILDEALCPACGTVQLELCGPFDNVLGKQSANA